MITNDYPQDASCTNTINGSTNVKSLRTFNSEDECENSSDTEALKASVASYFDEVFKSRNSSILTRDVEDLYKYFTKSTSDGRYTLHHELKRIAYIRDWANERNITFTNIS